jgi:hypothetical protein
MNAFQTELEVIRALAAGRVPSPQFFCRNTFAVLCLAQAGTHVRADGEIAYRDRADWLSDRMLARVIGTLIISDDVEKLDIESFPGRPILGVVVHAYRDDDRLMGIARLFPGRSDAQTESASLRVRVDDVDVVQLDDDNGTRVLIEGAPHFISHIVIPQQTEDMPS